MIDRLQQIKARLKHNRDPPFPDPCLILIAADYVNDVDWLTGEVERLRELVDDYPNHRGEQVGGDIHGIAINDGPAKGGVLLHIPGRKPKPVARFPYEGDILEYHYDFDELVYRYAGWVDGDDHLVPIDGKDCVGGPLNGRRIPMHEPAIAVPYDDKHGGWGYAKYKLEDGLYRYDGKETWGNADKYRR